MLDQGNVAALRMHRQYLTRQANEQEYEQLFRQMSPMHTEYWTSPGSPPSMPHRAAFDDRDFNQERRASREIVKGRFQGGGVAYVEMGDLELYAALYRKAPRLDVLQMELLELLRSEGPMSVQMMKEITGYLIKALTPALHKLQEAFLVFEDQTDSEWDRAWYLFEHELPDILPDRYTRQEALKIALLRFAPLCVWFDVAMARSFYRLTLADLRMAVDALVAEGKLVKAMNGYLTPEDLSLLKEQDFAPERSLYVLNRNDFLVKTQEHMLKKRFVRNDSGVLQYLLIDGAIMGASMGRFRFGPNTLDDILLDLPQEEAADRKEEIIDAVLRANRGSTLLNYCSLPV